MVRRTALTSEAVPSGCCIMVGRDGRHLPGFLRPAAERWVDMDLGSLLIVDDDQTALDTFRGKLEQTGDEVLLCRDSRLALGMAATAVLDVVLADHHMPEMDGAELVRRMRDRHVRAHLIGFSAADKERSFLEAGIDQFILKDQPLAAPATTMEERKSAEIVEGFR